MKHDIKTIVEKKTALTPQEQTKETAYIIGRRQKAEKIVAVLSSFYSAPELSACRALDIGCSMGAISAFLANHVGCVHGVDIDCTAIEYAIEKWPKSLSLRFECVDCLNIPLGDESFDIIICNGVYEHVPDAEKLISEIKRLLKKGGICYFSAMNKLALFEPHYRIPFLSMFPQPLASAILKILSKGNDYDVFARTYGGIKRLFSGFEVSDLSFTVIREPEKFKTKELCRFGQPLRILIAILARIFYWFLPTYLFILRKR